MPRNPSRELGQRLSELQRLERKREKTEAALVDIDRSIEAKQAEVDAFEGIDMSAVAESADASAEGKDA